MIEGVNNPCNYCDHNSESPLLHYLLECPRTATLRGNRIYPNIQGPNSIKEAAELCKDIVDNINAHSHLLLDSPPPR